MALINVTKVYVNWPPTLGEFQKLCREEPVRPEHRPLLQEPDPRGKPIDPEVRLSIIASLERGAKGLKRSGAIDVRDVCASTLAEVAGKIEKIPVSR